MLVAALAPEAAHAFSSAPAMALKRPAPLCSLRMASKSGTATLEAPLQTADFEAAPRNTKSWDDVPERKKKTGWITLMEAANGSAPGVGGVQAWETPRLNAPHDAKSWSLSHPSSHRAVPKEGHEQHKDEVKTLKKNVGWLALMEAAVYA
jgi:hypothetical protein